ncbi:MAG: hypothetical protein HOP25_10270 [Methylotenera sp.]|nr:hypothetical protein [Methylotenera sp.]
MTSTSIQLRIETEKKMREFIPYIHSDEDMTWVADWFISMGLAIVNLTLEQNPDLSIGELIKITMSDKHSVN